MKSKALVLGLALLLATFVSPFSYLPNPLGLYYVVKGEYSYDPNSLFVNRFATLPADPARAISIKLDQLIGQTGLDPLDPNQPLDSYQIHLAAIRPDPWRPWRGSSSGSAKVELRYADGSARTYEISVYQRSASPHGTAGWACTGLDRFFAPHQELPNLPFPSTDAPVRLGRPERLDLSLESHGLGTTSILGWTTSMSGDGEELRWAPDGRSFLLRTDPPDRGPAQPDTRPLWLVSIDSSPPRQVADNVGSYAWSADGRQIVYVRSFDRTHRDLMAVDPVTGTQRNLGEPPNHLFSVAGSFAYFSDGMALWRTPLDGQPSERLASLPDAGGPPGSAAATVAVSPDDQQVAYRCGNDVCLADLSGENHMRLPLDYPQPDGSLLPTKKPNSGPSTAGPVPTLTPAIRLQPALLSSLGLAWSHDSQRLAVFAGTHFQQQDSDWPPELYIFDRSGRLLHRLTVGPNGTAREPQWTPDRRFVLLNTFPHGGRRIVAVEVETERVIDLSQPRWDTFASLSPDGTQLLLWSGRGGFWTVPLER